MKNATTPTQSRRILLQIPLQPGALDSSDLSAEPIFKSINGSSQKTNSTLTKHPTSPLNSSMALTIFVLLSALFFMAFFSLYIRRFSEEDSSGVGRQRHPSRPPGLHGSNRKNRGGVDPSTIQSLPLVSYRGGAKQLMTDCPICLSEFEEEREIIKLIPSCGHVFHPECIDTWLSSHMSCPLCRSTQFFEVAEDEVRLDVVEEQNGNGGSDVDGRSTAGSFDTWRFVGMRRACSCTSLGDRLVLQRSMSF